MYWLFFFKLAPLYFFFSPLCLLYYKYICTSRGWNESCRFHIKYMQRGHHRWQCVYFFTTTFFFNSSTKNSRHFYNRALMYGTLRRRLHLLILPNPKLYFSSAIFNLTSASTMSDTYPRGGKVIRN